MKACPNCKSRATKIVSISTGLTKCQVCGAEYAEAVLSTKGGK